MSSHSQDSNPMVLANSVEVMSVLEWLDAHGGLTDGVT